MARGQQKLQSQAKAQEKQAKAKKQQGHSLSDQKAAAQKALGIQVGSWSSSDSELQLIFLLAF